jgi:hypothetical protein
MSDFTPRKRKLYHRIRRKESALCKLRKKYRSRKLKDLCDVDSDPLMQEISNSLNAEAVRSLAAFLGIVDTSQGKGGRILKKKFWLCLYLSLAQNPIFFFRHLPLPSGRTLQSLLNTDPFRTGIDTHAFDALHHSLQKMSEKDWYCCLLFDEMSVRENVWFNQKFDCIEGFEDLGSRGRTCNVANHALVFMVCGLHRKWKQPVASYLSRGSTKAEMLVQFLKEVLDA